MSSKGFCSQSTFHPFTSSSSSSSERQNEAQFRHHCRRRCCCRRCWRRCRRRWRCCRRWQPFVKLIFSRNETNNSSFQKGFFSFSAKLLRSFQNLSFKSRWVNPIQIRPYRVPLYWASGSSILRLIVKASSELSKVMKIKPLWAHSNACLLIKNDRIGFIWTKL